MFSELPQQTVPLVQLAIYKMSKRCTIRPLCLAEYFILLHSSSYAVWLENTSVDPCLLQHYFNPSSNSLPTNRFILASGN